MNRSLPTMFQRLEQFVSKFENSIQDSQANSDQFVYDLVQFYLDSDDASRRQVREISSTSKQLAEILRNFASRSAISLYRSTDDMYATVVPSANTPIYPTANYSIFLLGIGALAIENCTSYRESLTALAELCIRAERVGIQPRPLLEQMADLFSEKPIGGYGNELRPYSSIVRNFRKNVK